MTLPFTTDKNAVLRALQLHPELVSNVQLQWLRNQYPKDDYMQGVLAPLEHQAFAREVAGQGLMGAVGMGAAIPAYQGAKAFGMGSRTGTDLDQMWAAYQGLLQGLNQVPSHGNW